MRRFVKWLLIALGSLVVLLAIVITLTIGWSPFLGLKARALTNRTFERTPKRIDEAATSRPLSAAALIATAPMTGPPRALPWSPGRRGPER